MREIKFRVWEKDLSQMIDWDILERFQNLQHYFHSEWHEVMQYTGLKDKNGKEIYEGDVVSERGFISVIKWVDKGAYFHAFRGETSSGYTLQGEAERCEVIGNVWQHPELLTK